MILPEKYIIITVTVITRLYDFKWSITKESLYGYKVKMRTGVLFALRIVKKGVFQ
jgi:hypothetical protein